MPTDPLHWFPSVLYSILLAILFFGGYIADFLVPRLAGARRNPGQATTLDGSSYAFIHAAALISPVMAFLCRRYGWTVLPSWAQWLGLAVGAVGICYREWAIATLGRFFSRVVAIQTDHRLVTSGPYRRIRHPAYAGFILFNAGIAMGLGSGTGVLVSALVICAAVVNRIRIEEEALTREFGAEYARYARRTWRLVPGW